MKKNYEAPFLEIELFRSESIAAGVTASADYIPDTEYEDEFGDYIYP